MCVGGRGALCCVFCFLCSEKDTLRAEGVFQQVSGALLSKARRRPSRHP